MCPKNNSSTVNKFQLAHEDEVQLYYDNIHICQMYIHLTGILPTMDGLDQRATVLILISASDFNLKI